MSYSNQVMAQRTSMENSPSLSLSVNQVRSVTLKEAERPSICEGRLPTERVPQRHGRSCGGVAVQPMLPSTSPVVSLWLPVGRATPPPPPRSPRQWPAGDGAEANLPPRGCRPLRRRRDSFLRSRQLLHSRHWPRIRSPAAPRDGASWWRLRRGFRISSAFPTIGRGVGWEEPPVGSHFSKVPLPPARLLLAHGDAMDQRRVPVQETYSFQSGNFVEEAGRELGRA